MDVISLLSLDRLPAGCGLYAYGAGGRAVILLRMLDKFRPDITFLGFIDTYKTGTKDGHRVHNVGELPGLLQARPDAKIVITSTFAHQIYCELLRFGLDAVYALDDFPASINKLAGLSEQDIAQLTAGIEEACPVLRRPKDRELLRSLPAFYVDMADPEPAYFTIMDHYMELGEIYFDFINKDAIRTIIEGGVHDGNSTLRLLHHCPGAEIHGFEPLPATLKLSVFNTYIESKKNIRINYAGISDATSSLTLKILSENPHGASFSSQKDSSFTIESQTTSIDDYVRLANIPKVDFIKLDIESFEILALRGAAETIARDRPQLAVSVYHLPSHYYEIPLMLSRMCDGYNFYLGCYGIASGYDTILYGIPKELDKN